MLGPLGWEAPFFLISFFQLSWWQWQEGLSSVVPESLVFVVFISWVFACPGCLRVPTGSIAQVE